MNLEILKRRAEMLDAVSTGLHPSAVVTQLAEKYGVTERCLWSDWQRRERWVPVLLNLEKYAGFAEIVEQKLNAVQKAAWSIYLKASNDSARVGALRTVLEALEIHGDIVQTRDIIHVKEMLGHKAIQSTLIYTHLITFESDEYHSAAAKTTEDARSLIEAGFEYVCTHHDTMVFRKRK